MSGRKAESFDGSMENVKQRHLEYFRAVNNPIRRDILKALEGGEATIEILVQDKLGW